MMQVALFAAVVLAVVSGGCASVPSHPASAAIDVGCRQPAPGTQDLFCGARVGGPASTLCALPGYATRTGFLGSGTLAVRLADSSWIDADLDVDSTRAGAVLMNMAESPPPCAMEVRHLMRAWPAMLDPYRAAATYAAIAERQDRGVSDAKIQCRMTPTPDGWSLRRSTSTARSMHWRILAAYRSSGRDESSPDVAADRHLADQKVVLGSPSPSTPDTSAVRRRYVMQIEAIPGGTYAVFDSAASEFGAAACDRMEQRAREMIRTAAN
jgi:hypothetical protein